ncbi:MAG TPA: hypothetical protein VLZ12_16310, partial [Verrucomicrobiae bacterium]|nr:hypothetical protein [Verrucomicrobiae bacterium]
MLLAVGCAAAIVVLFYAEENWRGKHAWEKYKRESEARGDRFEWSAVVPPPVADEQNFAATPLFAELFPKPSGHPRLFDLPSSELRSVGGNWREARMEDFAVWRGFFPDEKPAAARPGPFIRREGQSSEGEESSVPQKPFTSTDVLAALSKHDAILREVSETSRRPECRFPIRYEDNFAARLPHLTQLRTLARIYRLRALAELDTRQIDAAFDDMLTGLRLADRLKDEPILISFVVRMRMVDMLLQPVWEGMQTHRWSEKRLAQLQTELTRIDYFAGFSGVLRTERVLACQTLLGIIRQPLWNRPFIIGGMTSDETADLDNELFCMGLSPRGWLYQNAVSVDRFWIETVMQEVNREARLVRPESVKRALQLNLDASSRPYQMLVRVFVDGTAALPKKSAYCQKGVDEATVACA